MTITDADEIKSLVKSLEEIQKTSTIETTVGSGLLIMTTVARTSTKKLESIIAALGGEVIIAKPGAKEGMTTGEKLINDLEFTREVKDYLLSYVGDDYEALIPIARSLSEIPKEQHKRITVEDIYIRLPKAPGAVPPWEIEKPLFGGDISKTIEVFRRIHQNSDLLVVLFVLKNKQTLAYRAGAMLEANPRLTSAQVADALGVTDNYPLKLAMGQHKRYGLEKLEALARLLADTERKVKGGSAMRGDVTMEIMLVEFQKILRG
jgi:DNA polymerase III delta subunit